MSDMEPPTEPTNRQTLTASCVCVCVQQQRRCQPKNICLLQNQPQNIHPEVTVREEGFPFWPPPSLLTAREIRSSPGATHHTARRVQLAVRDAAEILAAAPVVPGAVTDGAKGVKKDLQAVEGGRGHQLFPGGRGGGDVSLLQRDVVDARTTVAAAWVFPELRFSSG